jgi:O-methyltransferase involved in polyketide biosynthesis
VDLPGILAHKEEVLRGDKPVCALERVSMDLSDAGARRVLFESLGRRAGRVLVVSEGFLVYLSTEEVGSLARDPASPAGFGNWILDLASPGLLKMIQRNAGSQLSDAGATLRFGPAEGPGFFAHHGWKPVDVRSPLKTAARLKRKAAIEPNALRGSALTEYARLAGELFAKAHARTGDPAVIWGYCGNSQKLDRAIRQFAIAYADQATRDYTGFQRALRKRRPRRG